MKKLILLIAFFFTNATLIFSQPTDKSLVQEKSINQVEYEFSEQGIALRVDFNFTDTPEDISTFNFAPTFEAIISYNDGSTSEILESKNYWKGESYYIEFCDKKGIRIKKAEVGIPKWDKIEVNNFVFTQKLSDLSEIKGYLPTFSISPPPFVVPRIDAGFDTEGFIVGDASSNKIVLQLHISPKKLSYELTSLEIENKQGVVHRITGDNLKFEESQEGELKVAVTLLFKPNIEKYKAIAIIKEKQSGKEQKVEGEIVLTDSRPIQVLGVKPSLPIIVENSDKVEITVTTIGNGNLDLNFNKQNSNVILESKSVVGNQYTFVISNLLEINYDELDFFFQNGSQRLRETYKIIKNIPSVYEMSIDNINNNEKCEVKFSLPKWVQKDRLKLAIGNETHLLGKSFITSEEGNKTIYTAVFGNNENGAEITQDVIEKPIYLLFDNKQISTKINAKFINKTIVDEIKENLTIEANKNRRDRNPEEIKKWVEKAKELGIALGQSIDDGDVNTAIEGMADSRQVNARQTASNVGTWLSAIAGVVLMIL